MSSHGDPTTIVEASVESATSLPNQSPAAAVSFCCCVHVAPDRVYTYAAPSTTPPTGAAGAPTLAVAPSPERSTTHAKHDWSAAARSLGRASFACSAQVPPVRLKIHALPATVSVPCCPTIASDPSPETATAAPK